MGIGGQRSQACQGLDELQTATLSWRSTAFTPDPAHYRAVLKTLVPGEVAVLLVCRPQPGMFLAKVSREGRTPEGAQLR
jgi:hypothetical protein